MQGLVLRVVYDNITYDLSVDNTVPLRLDISAVDNTDIGVFYGVGSQEFDLPGTKINNQFFNHAYNLGTDNVPGFYQPITAYVIRDGETLLQGTMLLLEIVTNQDGFTTYKVIVNDEIISLSNALTNKLIKDADFSAYNHTLTSGSIIDSWEGNLLSGKVFYPLADYGTDESVLWPSLPRIQVSGGPYASGSIDMPNTPMRAQQFLPALKLKELLNVIFDQAGFSFTSSFADTNDFNRLYVLPKGKEGLGIVASNLDGNNVEVILSSSQGFTGFAGADPNPIVNSDIVQFNNEVSDPNNNFNSSIYSYVAPVDGFYVFDVQLSLDNPLATDLQDCSLILSGSSTQSGIIGLQGFDDYTQTGTIVLKLTIGIEMAEGQSAAAYLYVSNGDPNNNTNSGDIYSNGSYFKVIKSPISYENLPVDFSKQFDPETKSLDLLKGMIEKFNLVIVPEPGQRKTLRIETFDRWITTGENKDWTRRFDEAQRISIKNTIGEQPRVLKFTDAEDTDRFSKLAIESVPNDQYGTVQFLASSSLAQGERTVGSIYGPVVLGSATQYGLNDADNNPLYLLSNSEFVFPHLYKYENNKQVSYKFKPRIGYKVDNQIPVGAYSGEIWVGLSGSAQSSFSYSTLSNYNYLPTSGSCNNNLHYNDTYGLLIPESLLPISSSNNFQRYWEVYVTSLYWENNRKVTCTIEFNPEDYKDIQLNDLIYVKDQLYRINKISGLNLSYRDVAEVELIRLYPAYYNYVSNPCDYTPVGPTPTPTVTPTPGTATPTPTPTTSGSATPTPTPTSSPTPTISGSTPTPTPTATATPTVTPTPTTTIYEFRLFQSGSSFEVPPIAFGGAQEACDSNSTRIAETYTTSSALVVGTVLYQEIGRVNLLPTGSYLVSGSNQYIDIFPSGTVLILDTCVPSPTPTPTPVPNTYTFGIYGTNDTTKNGFGSDTDACNGTGEVAFDVYSYSSSLQNGTELYKTGPAYPLSNKLNPDDEWFAYIDGFLVRNSFRVVGNGSGVVSLYEACPTPTPTPTATPTPTPTPVYFPVQFNAGSGSNEAIYSLDLNSERDIYAGGIFTNYSGSGINYLVKIDISGSRDSSVNGVVGTVVNAVAVQSDDKPVIAGDITASLYKNITRLNTDGGFDNSFTGSAKVGFSNPVNALAIQSDGKILAGGAFTSYAGTGRNRIARLNNSSSLDTTFVIGTGFNDEVRSIALESDDEVIVGGWFTTYDGTSTNRIAKLDTDGTFNNSFKTSNGTGFNDNVEAVTVLSDGKILVGGSFTQMNGSNRGRLVRLNSNGSYDTNFDMSVGFGNGTVYTAIQSGSFYYIGGSFTDFKGNTRNRIIKLDSSGNEDNTFVTNMNNGFNGTVYSMKLEKGGTILVGGDFSCYSGSQHYDIVRINSNGTGTISNTLGLCPSPTPTPTATATITPTPTMTSTPTPTPTPTSTAVPCISQVADWDPDSVSDVCTSPTSVTVYMDTASFTTATTLSSNNTCTVAANVGYYKVSTTIRYWDGTTLGTAQLCPTATPTPTPTSTPTPSNTPTSTPTSTPTNTPTPTPTSTPTPLNCNTLTVGYDANNGNTACSNYGGSTIYSDQVDLQNATKLYSNNTCTNFAATGYYSDGVDYWYWNSGSETLSYTGVC